MGFVLNEQNDDTKTVYREYIGNGCYKTIECCNDGHYEFVNYFDSEGLLHNDDNDTASYIYYEDGCITDVMYYKHGIVHREGDKPSYIEYFEGVKVSESYKIDGKSERCHDKPAYLEYHDNGFVKHKTFYINGKIGRGNELPSIINYHKENGKVKDEIYQTDRKFHRGYTKPTIYKYDLEGNLTDTYYYNNGIEVTKEVKHLLRRKKILKTILDG